MKRLLIITIALGLVGVTVSCTGGTKPFVTFPHQAAQSY